VERTLCSHVSCHTGEEVRVSGWLEAVRQMGQLTFVVVRDRSGCCQAVFEEKTEIPPVQSVVSLSGLVQSEERAPGGAEITSPTLRTVSAAASPLPIEVNGRLIPLEIMLEHRVLSLRTKRATAILKISAEFVRAFREALTEQEFVEVFTPKIVGTGTEGGAELFPVKYFERTAYLAQSPQLYKQMMVGTGLERVFEVGPAFRAEEHNTSRHLNQFLSLDLEMAFIDGAEELMRLEERFLSRVLTSVAHSCAKELALLGCTVPEVTSIPRLDIEEAREMASSHTKRRMPTGNLDPEGERAVCEVVARDTGSEFVFIMGYPEAVRPFYAMPDPERPGKTQSFDLLFRGLEVTTGGQRIHDYEQLLAKMRRYKLDPEQFSGYLEPFKYGMPPHGGLAMGAERFVARLCGLPNVREACAFPRDRTRLAP
jgi:nondiscriminating aspartyl-tRNA synthetase